MNIDQEALSVFDYDKDNLIVYDTSDYYKKGETRSKSHHVILSKQDGSITREIFIPLQTINSLVARKGKGVAVAVTEQIRPTHGKWILTDTSSDTLYNYAPDGTLTPFIVRTPSAHTMEPEVFVFMGIQTDRYYFLQAMRNEFNFEKGRGFPSDELMYDKEENAIFQFTISNGDYLEKRGVAMTASPINQEIEDATTLDASRLVEDYEKGLLKEGKLKEIASRLDEETNPVIMLKKHKR